MYMISMSSVNNLKIDAFVSEYGDIFVYIFWRTYFFQTTYHRSYCACSWHIKNFCFSESIHIFACFTQLQMTASKHVHFVWKFYGKVIKSRKLHHPRRHSSVFVSPFVNWFDIKVICWKLVDKYFVCDVEKSKNHLTWRQKTESERRIVRYIRAQALLVVLSGPFHRWRHHVIW